MLLHEQPRPLALPPTLTASKAGLASGGVICAGAQGPILSRGLLLF